MKLFLAVPLIGVAVRVCAQDAPKLEIVLAGDKEVYSKGDKSSFDVFLHSGHDHIVSIFFFTSAAPLMSFERFELSPELAPWQDCLIEAPGPCDRTWWTVNMLGGTSLICDNRPRILEIDPMRAHLGTLEGNVVQDEELPRFATVYSGGCDTRSSEATFEDSPFAPVIDVESADPVMVATQRRPFVRGDANVDGVVDISDPISVLNILFVIGGEGYHCPNGSDANDDNKIDISDGVYVLNYLFVGGAPPPPPFPEPGYDPNATSPEHTGCDGL